MPLPPLLKIDASNRSAHFYLEEEHECFFFYEYMAREGPRFSDGNQFIFNLKKPLSARGQPHYQYKAQAITRAGAMLREAFNRSPWVFENATIAPIPPSKLPTHPEYDDRMSRVVIASCTNTNADVREFITQCEGYCASHEQGSGARLKPHELETIYELSASPPPKSVVILVDDVLTTGAHFLAARSLILRHYPRTRVIGFFLARRVVPNIVDDFDAL
jgi:predicted amidophosphoribosyltransferase